MATCWLLCDVEVDRDTMGGGCVVRTPSHVTPAPHGNLNQNYHLLQKHPGFLILSWVGIMVLRGYSPNLFDPNNFASLIAVSHATTYRHFVSPRAAD